MLTDKGHYGGVSPLCQALPWLPGGQRDQYIRHTYDPFKAHAFCSENCGLGYPVPKEVMYLDYLRGGSPDRQSEERGRIENK